MSPQGTWHAGWEQWSYSRRFSFLEFIIISSVFLSFLMSIYIPAYWTVKLTSLFQRGLQCFQFVVVACVLEQLIREWSYQSKALRVVGSFDSISGVYHGLLIQKNAKPAHFLEWWVSYAELGYLGKVYSIFDKAYESDETRLKQL